MAVVVAVVVALGSGTLAFTRLQRDVFNDTTSRFEQHMGTLAELQQEILDAEIPIGGVLYELGRTGELEDQWRQFQQHADGIENHFLDLRGAVQPSGIETLDRADRAWRSVVDGVTGARGMWGTGEVSAALARGEDPFGPTVWASLTETQHALATLSVDGVAALRVRSDQADHRQAALEPFLFAAVVVALVFSALSWRRLSTRVVRPLIALRAGAAHLRDGDLTRAVDLGSTAGREVAELATSMNDMAVALNHSHGRLRQQAYTDTLTGLANRRALTGLLEDLFPRALEEPLALLLVDLDDFKFVNDSMGHSAGDELLAAVAGRLQSAARAGDTVARLGGDEFAVLVRAHDPIATATVVAERILASLQERFEIDGTPVQISCSIGIAAGPPQATSADELVRNADVAMYMAKSRGKHCYDQFDGAMHAAMASRVELRTDLARAVESDELELHYQPVIDLHSSEVLGFEALVRWRHPTRGLLPPVEFIGMAEETGDIHALGGWVINQACQDLTHYQAVAGSDRNLWMAVNVSGSQVLTGNLVETVRAALSRHGVRPDALVLEVTEETLVDTDQVAAVLGHLRDDGVRVAIDDFGTGFSSLRYLHELPVDCLKIDRSFVADSHADLERGFILETIITMGRGLGLQLIAEGIERVAERDRLAELGPMAGQGYLFARPMPTAEMTRFLRDQPELSRPTHGRAMSRPHEHRSGAGVTAGNNQATPRSTAADVLTHRAPMTQPCRPTDHAQNTRGTP